MYRIITHSYPNNEVRAVFSALPTLNRKACAEGSDSANSPHTSSSQGLVRALSENNTTSSSLSLAPNSKLQRRSAGYGDLPAKPTKFGLNARRILIRSGAALEKSINDPSECLFLTGTLPGSTPDSLRAIAQYSGYIVNCLKAWIAKKITAKLDFYCWEYQRRGALHLHYCIYAQDEQARTEIQRGFKDWWIGILHRIGEKTSTDLFRKNSQYTHLSDPSKVRAVAEVCRKSPARYLAKYLSKSTVKLRGRARFFTPSRFWGTSRPLKKILEALTKKVEIIQGSYMACVKKLQEVKTATEQTEGLQYVFNHKYGLGQTILIYPASSIDNKQLFEDLTDMGTLSRINKQLENFKPSVMLRPHKKRLLSWSYHWINALPQSETGMISALKSFYETLLTLSPSLSEDPLLEIYQWRNILYNLNEVIGHSACAKNYRDRILIDTTLADLEIAISYICTRGWD